MANQNQRDIAKQLPAPFATHCTHDGCELFYLIAKVGTAELLSSCAIAVYECWNVSEKYTWDNAADLKQLSMDQTCSEDNRSHLEAIFSHGNTSLIKVTGLGTLSYLKLDIAWREMLTSCHKKTVFGLFV